MAGPWKPTPKQIAAAQGKKVRDVIAPGLKVLFCGINPGLYSGAIGHHFGRPGNRFWPALHLGGFTDRQLSPFEERELLARGCGITNFVDRATATADDLADAEICAGGGTVAEEGAAYRPAWVAFLGVGSYRTAFGDRKAAVGRQPRTWEGAGVWLLPNPSGLNAHYRLADLARVFAELRQAADA